jgi:hypothetical protein
MVGFPQESDHGLQCRMWQEDQEETRVYTALASSELSDTRDRAGFICTDAGLLHNYLSFHMHR